MTTDLSRRGLFRAFRLPVPDNAAGASDAPASDSVVAHIGEGCVEPRGVMCRRCGDECDSRAISFRPLGRGRAAPAIDAASCTGCGGCVPVCPVRAIEMIPAERLALAAGLAELGRLS